MLGNTKEEYFKGIDNKLNYRASKKNIYLLQKILFLFCFFYPASNLQDQMRSIKKLTSLIY